MTEEFPGIWVFYSGEKLGPPIPGVRIEGKRLQKYVQRINDLEGVTARNVNIKGKQREPIAYKCKKCGTEVIGEQLSEKGIDSSLTVHLFDTMDSWDNAFLFSGDADYVPVINSLRRRGKIISGVGFPDASSALKQECYSYIVLNEFLKSDIITYSIFKHGGIAQEWLTKEVKRSKEEKSNDIISLRIYWYYDGLRTKASINFDYDRKLDLSNRHQKIAEFRDKYIDKIKYRKNNEGMIDGLWIQEINPVSIECAMRRIKSEFPKEKGFSVSETGISVKYKLDEKASKYVVVEEGE